MQPCSRCSNARRSSVQQQVEEELHRIYQAVLIDNNIRIETLLTQHGIRLKPDQSYAVMLMHWPEEANIEMAALRAEMQKFGASHNLPTLIPLHWNNYTFTLISAFYHESEYRGLMHDSSQEMTIRWQQAFEDHFHVPLSIGVGNAHPISDLHKSFHEARIAPKRSPSSSTSTSTPPISASTSTPPSASATY